MATMQSHNRVADLITKCITESGFLLDISIEKGGRGLGIANGNVVSNTSVKRY